MSCLMEKNNSGFQNKTKQKPIGKYVPTQDLKSFHLFSRTGKSSFVEESIEEVPSQLR